MGNSTQVVGHGRSIVLENAGDLGQAVYWAAFRADLQSFATVAVSNNNNNNR